MPKVIKKKVTKKTGLKEEKVKNAAVRSLDVLKGKKRIFIFIALFLGIAVISTITFVVYSSSIKKKAYSFEKDAYTYYYNINFGNSLTEEERWRKSLELFQKAIEVKSTPSALFYLGNCYFNLGDYDNAIKAYNEFIDKYESNEEILPLVYQKLASAYTKKGKNDEAIKILDTLAEFKDGIFKDTALILVARHYELIGKPELALKKSRELVKDFPFSPWAFEANARLKKEEGKESVVPDKPSSEGGIESGAE